jgi:hypothetical protein
MMAVLLSAKLLVLANEWSPSVKRFTEGTKRLARAAANWQVREFRKVGLLRGRQEAARTTRPRSRLRT